MVTNCTFYFLHRRCESVNAVNCELLTLNLIPASLLEALSFFELVFVKLVS